MKNLSDDDLMQMYCDGDAEAFDTLFDQYRVLVYNFARVMLGNADEAEEVLQESFLAVARTARKHYTPRGRFRAWLMRIVRNQCLNRIEAHRLRRIALTESGLDIAEVPSDALQPGEKVEADEQKAIIRASIANLPDRQREAITLYAFEQMSYREIAEIIGMPINTVKTLIHRARASLAVDFERFESEH